MIADSRPDDEGFADAVAAFGKEDDSLVRWFPELC